MKNVQIKMPVVLIVCMCLWASGFTNIASAQDQAPIKHIDFETDSLSTPSPPTTPPPPPEPPPSGDPRAPLIIESLTPAEVRAVVQRAKPALLTCQSEAGKADLHAGFTLAFTIQTDGSVSEAKVAFPDSPTGAACLEGVLRGLRFPTSGMLTQVNYPLR